MDSRKRGNAKMSLKGLQWRRCSCVLPDSRTSILVSGSRWASSNAIACWGEQGRNHARQDGEWPGTIELALDARGTHIPATKRRQRILVDARSRALKTGVKRAAGGRAGRKQPAFTGRHGPPIM
ncbi:hypothetical protein M514_26711 [Trichuris suis]|uniref:Uncharacterized protein n=1 Tax=Trichuris suis TaxID=68888 RepID=A0A085MV72_9BILA|nr:hypothetical protein M514_26711 [Trichuris suis]